jgi:hypothetical protein
MDTPWGRLPVVGIPDLVELKKTNRASDYEVISRLARIMLSASVQPGRAMIRWALENSFRVEDVLEIASQHPRIVQATAAAIPRLRPLERYLRRGKVPGSECADRIAGALAREVVRRMELGRRYWSPRLAELRELRARGMLLPEGLPVRELLRTV